MLNNERKPEQLILPIPFPPEFKLENFVLCSGNREAFNLVSKHAGSESEIGNILLHGQAGTGKTHLLRALWKNHEERNRGFSYIFFDSDPAEQETFIESASRIRSQKLDMVFIENVHALTEWVAGEQRFYDIFNFLVQANIPMVLTSREHPSRLNSLHDRTRSRLSSCIMVKIGHLDEETCVGILRKLAADRQIELSEQVLSYIFRRIPRNPSFMRSLFNDIDHQALQRKKPITVHLVRHVLAHKYQIVLDDL